MSNSRVALTTAPGGAPSYPLSTQATTVATGAPTTTNPLTPQQTLGVGSGTLNVPYPAFTGFHDLSFSMPLGLPFAALTRTAAGIVAATIALSGAPADGILVGLPALTLSVNGATRATTWTLGGGQSYPSLSVNVDVRLYAPSAVSAGTLTFLAQSTLNAVGG